MLRGNLDPADKCSKIRLLVNMIKEKCKKLAIMTRNVNVVESMILYYGKPGQKLKQRMPLKSIRLGFKVWCLNLPSGYLYNFEVYQGKGSKNDYADDFGLGPSVIIGLVKSLPMGNFSVFIDSYFNSVLFMKYLKLENTGCTGTVKVNMSQGSLLPPKNEFKKQPKGSYQAYQEQNSGVEMVICNSNGTVTVGSNCQSIQPLPNARRWFKEAKDYISVLRPAMNGCYNSSMGGTDQMDQSTACYRPFIRNRKWY